jgi:hypothetical protein
MFTAEQSLSFLDTNQVQASSMNFKKVDSQLYSSQIPNLKKLGFSLESLKNKYSDIKDISFDFGLEIGKMPHEIYNGQLGKGSEYISKRLGVLNELIQLFQSAQNPEDLHKIVAFLEMSKKAAGGNTQKAYHYLEAMEAAKIAIKGDSEAEENFKKYDKSVIYDNLSLQKTISELIRRKEHLEAIQNQGFDSFEKHGLVGRISDNGIQTALQFSTVFGIAKSFKNFDRVKSILSGANNADQLASNLGFFGKALNFVTKNSKSAFSGGWKKMGSSFGPWGKFFVLGASVIIAGSKLYTSYNEKDNFIHTVGKTVKDIYYGDAKNFGVATASWILPGFGSLYGTSFFHTEQQKRLEELKKEGVVNVS